MHVLSGAAEARKTVDYWADLGVTSFKAYMHVTRAELKAAIDAAHSHGLKITGHLCSVTFSEAARLGIDDLEHGLLASTDFVPGKQPDRCPAETDSSLLALDVASAPVATLIQELVSHQVAITSTLPVFETFAPQRPPLVEGALDAMSADAKLEYLDTRSRIADRADSSNLVLLRKEMAFEYAFARAGGLLLAGSDPTGYGGVVAGFANQREIELLVEAGFTPLEAIQIATWNGARYLKREHRIGSIAVGLQADLVVVRGDPTANIRDIEKVELVFKRGVGYNPGKLIESVRGHVGLN
jgi:imidazolonepropionase-like amidohydrolase